LRVVTDPSVSDNDGGLVKIRISDGFIKRRISGFLVIAVKSGIQ